MAAPVLVFACSVFAGWAAPGDALASPDRVTGTARDAKAVAPAAAGAQVLPGVEDLVGQLADADAERRKAALEALTQREPDALEPIEALLTRWKAAPLARARVEAILQAFARAASGPAADDGAEPGPDTTPDLTHGALAVLESERGPDVCRVASTLALLRAIEGMPAGRLDVALANLITLDEGAWTGELQRTASRAARGWLPASIALKSTSDVEIRRWAQANLERLNATDPETITQQVEPHQLAEMLRAYASSLDFGAMPLVVSFVGDERIAVREAARQATARFGRNAIWQLRERYEEHTGRRAERSWSWKRTARELYSVLDRPRIEASGTLLAEGAAARSQDDLTAMAARYDKLLRQDPTFARAADMAPGYAELGAAHLGEDRLPEAAAAYRRAVRLAPEHGEVKHWRAQIEFIGAEQTLIRGVVDLPGYRAALALDPNHTGAREALAHLQPDEVRNATGARRWAGLLAILLLAAFGLLVLRKSRPTPSDPEVDEQEAAV